MGMLHRNVGLNINEKWSYFNLKSYYDHLKEADLALGPFVYNQERTRVALFSHPIHMDSTVILSKKSSTKKMQLKILNIFTWEVS